ncbi:MAG: hypothetical protein HZC55_27525 [Verrucomicrobia bacterium]|nr:hypothetical protein [Verrucomicrobiota bacterium]
MARLATHFLFSATFAVMAGPDLRAQTAPPASPILNAAPADTPAPSSSSPRRSRAISGEAAAALAAAAPKYTPPPPKPPPKPEEEMVDMREVDKPKNAIVRLPKYIVQEKKPAVFRERDIHTEKGLTDIAMRRYMSEADRALNRWTLPLFGISKEARARAMYEEDERLQNMSDLRDAGVNATRSDPAAGSYILRESQKTFLRSSDFGWNGGGPR